VERRHGKESTDFKKGIHKQIKEIISSKKAGAGSYNLRTKKKK
jgi:hypothetical protein